MEMEGAEERLRREAAALAELDRARARLEAAGVGAEIQVRSWSPLAGNDLAALGSYRAAVRRREKEIDSRRAESRERLASERTGLMEARRRFRLLERLKDRRSAEWEAARDRETEALAAESYLARWGGRRLPYNEEHDA
jgi:hypothetical protein